MKLYASEISARRKSREILVTTLQQDAVCQDRIAKGENENKNILVKIITTTMVANLNL